MPARNIVAVCSGSHEKKVNLGEVLLKCTAKSVSRFSPFLDGQQTSCELTSKKLLGEVAELRPTSTSTPLFSRLVRQSLRVLALALLAT
jgi:hypothetical protein